MKSLLCMVAGKNYIPINSIQGYLFYTLFLFVLFCSHNCCARETLDSVGWFRGQYGMLEIKPWSATRKANGLLHSLSYFLHITTFVLWAFFILSSWFDINTFIIRLCIFWLNDDCIWSQWWPQRDFYSQRYLFNQSIQFYSEPRM